MRNFRNYEVWIQAVEFSTEIYKVTSTFPKFEIYGLCDQMQRASVSISSNIAEGCSRESEKDFSHFLEIAIGSAFEIETQLLIAKNLGYIDSNKYEELVDKLSINERQIHSLILKVKPQKAKANANS